MYLENTHFKIGTIKCRLRPGENPLKTLCTRLRDRENTLGEKAKPVFLISNGTLEDRKMLSSEKLDSASSRVFQNKPFQLEVTFNIYDRTKRVGMYLSLSDDFSKDSFISGFPRHLLGDGFIAEGRICHSQIEIITLI